MTAATRELNLIEGVSPLNLVSRVLYHSYTSSGAYRHLRMSLGPITTYRCKTYRPCVTSSDMPHETSRQAILGVLP